MPCLKAIITFRFYSVYLKTHGCIIGYELEANTDNYIYAATMYC